MSDDCHSAGVFRSERSIANLARRVQGHPPQGRLRAHHIPTIEHSEEKFMHCNIARRGAVIAYI
jgi:hypothetical protein